MVVGGNYGQNRGGAEGSTDTRPVPLNYRFDPRFSLSAVGALVYRSQLPGI